MSALALAASLALPFASLAASVALATSPLATSTTSTVLPNLMFMLDDSGSMDWDYMPDDAKNFAGKYGFNSSHCNGVYYNPNITYTPPVDSDGVSYANSSFSAAWKDGYSTGAGTVNLNTSFTGGSGSGSSGAASYTGPAFYYTYSGTQTTGAQMNFHNTNSTFYKECASNIGSTPRQPGIQQNQVGDYPDHDHDRYDRRRQPGHHYGRRQRLHGTVSSIKVNGRQILNATTSSIKNQHSTVANNIANGINNCTTVATGNCTMTGFSASPYRRRTAAQVIIASPASAGGYGRSSPKAAA